MTNGDYVRSVLTDRQLVDMYLLTGYDDNFHVLCHDAFKKWCADFGSVKSNVKQNNPSPYYWQKIYDEDTKKWKESPVKRSVALQIFLSKPYEERFWKK